MKISHAIRDYIDEIKTSQSPQTAETYEQGMRRFVEFLSTMGYSTELSVEYLTTEVAIRYVRWLSGERNSDKNKLARPTLQTYLASIKRFFRYLLQYRLIEISMADFEQMQEAFRSIRRGKYTLPKVPSDDAVVALLDAARQVQPQPKRPRLELARLRNIAMLEALRSSGMRVGELVTLKRDDLEHRNHSARVTGKGDKQRIVYFDDQAWNASQEYLKARNDSARGRALYHLPLFARHDRRVSNQVLPLTTDSVRLVFNQLGGDAGIEITLTPHSLRHAFATKVLEATGDLAVVQDMLGHSSPATTRIYAKVSNKKMREAHRRAFGYQPPNEDQ